MRQRGDFDPHRRGQARLVVQGAIGPFGCLVKASRAEMSDGDRKGVEERIPIERARAARSFDRRDGRLGLVARRVDIASGHPGVSCVRVERQGAIERSRRRRRLAGQPEKRHGRLPDRFGVIALGFKRLSRQSAGLADIVSGQRSPSLNPLHPPTDADHRCRRRVRRIDRQRLPGEDDRFAKAVFGIPVGLCQCAQIKVVGRKVRGRLARGAFDLGLAQFWFDRTGDVGRDLILQIENVVERALEVVGPDVSAGRRVDQLSGDAHPVGGFAHAALEHVAHAQFPRHLRDVERLALVGEGGVAGDDKEPRQPRDRRRYLLDHTVDEILLLGVAGHVLKRQDHKRRLLGQCQRRRFGGRDWPDKAIAATGHGLDPTVPAGDRAECAAQGGDLNGKVAFLDCLARPRGFDQRFLRDQCAGTLYQRP